MNFAESAVKDHSAEQSPSRAGPYSQQDSHSLASGHWNRQFPWSRNGPQTDPTRFLAQHWGEVKLQWHGSNHRRESPTHPGSGLILHVSSRSANQPTITSLLQLTIPKNPGARLQPHSSWGNCCH